MHFLRKRKRKVHIYFETINWYPKCNIKIRRIYRPIKPRAKLIFWQQNVLFQSQIFTLYQFSFNDVCDISSQLDWHGCSIFQWKVHLVVKFPKEYPFLVNSASSVCDCRCGSHVEKVWDTFTIGPLIGPLTVPSFNHSRRSLTIRLQTDPKHISIRYSYNLEATASRFYEYLKYIINVASAW